MTVARPVLTYFLTAKTTARQLTSDSALPLFLVGIDGCLPLQFVVRGVSGSRKCDKRALWRMVSKATSAE